MRNYRKFYNKDSKRFSDPYVFLEFGRKKGKIRRRNYYKKMRFNKNTYNDIFDDDHLYDYVDWGNLLWVFLVLGLVIIEVLKIMV